MRELLATIEAWRAEGADIARAVVVRTYGSVAACAKARRCCAPRTAASPVRSAVAVSRGPRAEHLAEARASGLAAGRALRRQRRAGLGGRAGLRRRHRRPRPAAPSRTRSSPPPRLRTRPARPTGVRARPSSRRCRPGRRARSRAPRRSVPLSCLADLSWSPLDGSLEGSLGSPDADATLVAEARAAWSVASR